ncbi:ATP-binding protein [Sphingobium sp. CR28]|uniref:ATP-binding protein n=1 Tax=Sphingobium sp. CR28 TaxID=3400272 RepID=UPI003FF017F4
MISSLLIANRGEIACRIIRTARAMGIRTIAIYSDADAKALHVRQADEAVHIGPSPARQSYLAGEKIIAAALATGAEAIHPGYGFLSENADFAQAVMDAGLIWVGATPRSIRAMGLKDAAKSLMQAAGVPVTPGYLGEDQSSERLKAEADLIGYPLLIKAIAGGGGKGMRRVDEPADFLDALTSCKREAEASFSDDRVLIEKYILSPRHIEVQVFGDAHGNIVHLFERDCSLQRRHQKVIEEAPAPGVTEFTRTAICDIAVRAARAVNYVGAGTVEFIADGSAGYIKPDSIWFMEMNTRLQVEHPVTEEITGQDLVEWQLRVASGERLPKRQDELSINGHAVEARLYAEDPATGFLPSTGRLEHFSLVKNWNERVETGVEPGDAISPFYDPMIAKLIGTGVDRDAAIESLGGLCRSVEVWPVRTNAGFLARLLDEEAFRAGNITTGYIAEHVDALATKPPPTLLRAAAEELIGPVVQAVAKDLRGFRMNGAPITNGNFVLDGEERTLSLSQPGEDAFFGHIKDGDALVFFESGEAYRLALPQERGAGGESTASGAILAPMPGRIIAVEVSEGQAVVKGQKLLTLEAMKMEHTLTAPFDGIVSELLAEVGAQVQVEALLVRIEPVGGGEA